MLEGELVRLRAMEPEDAGNLRAWVNDPEVTEWTSARYPYSLGDEARWLEGLEANAFVPGVYLSIEAKDGRHIGLCELRNTRPENRKAELAITIGEKDYWNRGYGTDAVRTIVRFAFETMNLHRVWLTTLVYNTRAIACYKTCGFQEEGRLREEVLKHGRRHDYVIMGILREDFDSLYRAPVEKEAADA
jgi:RimJ/RimL family protein N-acetyltransferase